MSGYIQGGLTKNISDVSGEMKSEDGARSEKPKLAIITGGNGYVRCGRGLTLEFWGSRLHRDCLRVFRRSRKVPNEYVSY